MDISGQHFGRLTAFAPTSKRQSRSVVWKCRCLCGRTTEATASMLRHGCRLSCGCLRAERGRKGLRRGMESPNTRGLLNVNGKLSEAEVLGIRRLAAEGFSAKAIVETLALSISVGYAHVVMRGDSHHWLKEPEKVHK